MQDRVTGYSSVPVDPNRPPKRAGTAERDRRDFPGFFASGLWFAGSGGPIRPGFMTPGEVRNTNLREQRACTGPITYTGQAAVKADVANLKAAIAGKDVEGYIAALGPLSLGAGVRNDYYKSEEEYMMAVADACARSTRRSRTPASSSRSTSRSSAPPGMFYPDWSVEEYRKYLEFCVEVLNHSHRGPAGGADPLPHLLGQRPPPARQRHRAASTSPTSCSRSTPSSTRIEAANVRHEHEYHVWEDVKLPAGKMLMPGVISPRHRPGRAPGAGRRAPGQLRRARRPRERADRHRLRHRLARRPRRGRLGQAQGDVRRRRNRLEEALGQVRVRRPPLPQQAGHVGAWRGRLGSGSLRFVWRYPHA